MDLFHGNLLGDGLAQNEHADADKEDGDAAREAESLRVACRTGPHGLEGVQDPAYAVHRDERHCEEEDNNVQGHDVHLEEAEVRQDARQHGRQHEKNAQVVASPDLAAPVPEIEPGVMYEGQHHEQEHLNPAPRGRVHERVALVERDENQIEDVTVSAIRVREHRVQHPRRPVLVSRGMFFRRSRGRRRSFDAARLTERPEAHMLRIRTRRGGIALVLALVPCVGESVRTLLS
mmetsp:Transcript_38696/g.106588  ORF Transcript_38696/g.106588 Transcript_38696/m.106588 type:complete len:233 (+) Transcript_38696:107-805(+)